MKKQKKSIHKKFHKPKFQTKSEALVSKTSLSVQYVEDTNISGVLRILDKPAAFLPITQFQRLNPCPPDYGNDYYA